jgi:hypothetical protein
MGSWDRYTWAWVLSVAVALLALLIEPGVLVAVGVPDHLAATYQARVALAIAALGVVVAALRRGPGQGR